MANITFFGGIGEIGGNKILLEDGETRIFLDFGMSFSLKNNYYDEFLQPRTNSCLRDQLSLGTVPPIDGIYRTDLIEVDGVVDLTKKFRCPDYWCCELKSYDMYSSENGSPFVSAVLLSHAHADHYQYISFLDPNISIVCSPETKIMLNSISDVSKSSVENEFYEVKPRSLGKCGSRSTFPGEPTIKNATDEERIMREFDVIQSLETKTIGSIEVTALPVDHSVPGAYAYYIKTSDGKRILYTGDIRFHGLLEERSAQFNKFIEDNEVDVLITEGTRINKDNKDDETQVEKDITDLVSKDGLTIVEFGWKDTTRFETIQKIAETTGKTLVVSPKTAYLLHKLHEELPDQFKSIEDYGNVRCYLKRREGMIYELPDYSKDKHNAEYNIDWGGYSKEMKKAFESSDEDYMAPRLVHFREGVKATDIKKAPQDYIIMLSFFDMNELFDLSPPEGSVYIQARCEPFNDEMALDDEKLERWLEKFRVNIHLEEDLPNLHASGHASGPEIKELIRKINPSKLFPIHVLGEHLSHFDEFGEIVTKPVVGEEYPL